MNEPVTKEYLDERIDEVLTTVKHGFDTVDKRFDFVDRRFELIEEDLTHFKQRLGAVENELHAISAQMVTKVYLDEKLDQLMALQYKDSLFKRTLILALEQAKVLAPDMRVKLEALIP